MIKNKKKILFGIFFIYILTGTYLSLINGISHDQFHEQLNWNINLKAIKSIFLFNDEYVLLVDYIDKYHGIAFHYISQPFQIFLNVFTQNINNVDKVGAIYISRHVPTFLIYCLAGYYFYLICFKVSNNLNFSITCSIIFFLYPYLFGHSQINAKDIPFLSFWIISTYYLLVIIKKFYFDNKIFFYEIITLSFLTGFLVSIRITGILILLQYLISIIVLINFKKIDIFKFLNKNKFFFIIFSILFLISVYILNPILWADPLEIFNSLKWMSKYYNSTCTLTLGKCMEAQNLPSSYIFIWLFFKLPILVILGFFLFPIVEKKLFKKNLNSIFYSILLISFLSIIFILILTNVALYDEIRHLMFLIPLILLISLFNIYLFNKNIFYFLSTLTIIFFILENINLNKYQYTWLNSFAKFISIEKNFEIDYWGISNKNLQKQIIKYVDKNKLDKKICIYGDLYTDVFLKKFNFTCFKTYSEIDAVKNKPFIAYQNLRNLKRSNPKDCELIHSEKYNYTFYSKDLVVGKVWYCT
jgi:hypothetical protein